MDYFNITDAVANSTVTTSTVSELLELTNFENYLNPTRNNSVTDTSTMVSSNYSTVTGASVNPNDLFDNLTLVANVSDGANTSLFEIENNLKTILTSEPMLYRMDWNGSMYPSGYSTFHIILTSIILTTIMIIVVVGNMLVCIAIVTEKSLKTIQNWFIASLAVSDFLIGLIVMPFSLANELMGYWIFGVIWCEMWLAIDVLLCTASILNLCLISLDRYWSITQAVDYLKKRTPRRAALMIIFVWISAGIISLPPLVGWKHDRNTSEYPTCFVSRDIGYVLYSASGSFYFPAFVMVFVYIRIFFAARSRAFRNVKRRPQCPEVTNDHVRDKSTTTTTTTTTSFSNASLPDVAKIDSATFVTKSPILPVKQSENGKGKHCNTSNALVPPSSATLSSLPSGGMKKFGKSPNTEKKVVTLGNVEFKHLGKNVISDHKELSEIYEDGEDLSQTQSSEMEESATTEQTSPTLSNEETRDFCMKWCCCTFETVNNKNGKKGENKMKKQRRRKRKRDKKHKDNSHHSIHTAADSERLKRRLARAKERRATLILGLIMAAFILCWLPFFTTYVVQAITGIEAKKSVFAFVFWLGYCNSALNPIIYTIFNRDFRKAFRKILFK